jgi:hypothetical protein
MLYLHSTVRGGSTLGPGGPGHPVAAQAPQIPLMLFPDGSGLPTIGWEMGPGPQNFWARTAPEYCTAFSVTYGLLKALNAEFHACTDNVWT